jgi:hypothetical protein
MLKLKKIEAAEQLLTPSEEATKQLLTILRTYLEERIKLQQTSTYEGYTVLL